jgi:hypothetical protein
MKLRIRSSIFAIAAFSLVFGLTGLKGDAEDQIRASVIPTPSAPVALTHCFALAEGNYYYGSVNAINRSDVFLESYVVRFSAYDHSGTLMGQQDTPFSFNTNLAPNDTTNSGNTPIYGNTEPMSALNQVKCRLQSAKFEGGLSWTYGRVWHRRLSPLPHVDSLDNESGTAQTASIAPPAQMTGFAGVNLKVENGWNDIVNGANFVHVAIDVRAGNSDALVKPNDLHLTMKLANGGVQDFTAMAGPAPTYQKFDALAQNSNTTTAYEVDPKEDLGALGSVKISANSMAHIVATFAIGNAVVADLRDNQHVALR